jgi:hypothetical protein
MSHMPMESDDPSSESRKRKLGQEREVWAPPIPKIFSVPSAPAVLQGLAPHTGKHRSHS